MKRRLGSGGLTDGGCVPGGLVASALMRSPRRRSRGFSLTEMLVVIAIFGILTAAMGMGLLSAQRSWAVGTTQGVITAEVRKTLDQVSRELVESRASQIQRPAADGAWDTALLFRVPQDLNGDGSVLDSNGAVTEWSNLITYSMGRNNNCQRAEVNPPGTLPRTDLTTVANHISDVRFRRQAATPDVVEIQVTASRINELAEVMNRTMGTRVKLRNG